LLSSGLGDGNKTGGFFIVLFYVMKNSSFTCPSHDTLPSPKNLGHDHQTSHHNPRHAAKRNEIDTRMFHSRHLFPQKASVSSIAPSLSNSRHGLLEDFFAFRKT